MKVAQRRGSGRGDRERQWQAVAVVAVAVAGVVAVAAAVVATVLLAHPRVNFASKVPKGGGTQRINHEKKALYNM